MRPLRGISMATDPESLTDTQRAILQLAANNSEISNAEIAAETGTHVALVRDLRSEHDGLPADDGGNSASTAASGDESHDEPTKVQSEILAVALDDPDLTNREIADRLGARITLVRDTRRKYEDDVELANLDAEPPSSADTGAEPSAATGADEDGNGNLIVLLLVVVLLLGLAFLLL